jgi:hypothetical protein
MHNSPRSTLRFVLNAGILHYRYWGTCHERLSKGEGWLGDKSLVSAILRGPLCKYASCLFSNRIMSLLHPRAHSRSVQLVHEFGCFTGYILGWSDLTPRGVNGTNNFCSKSASVFKDLVCNYLNLTDMNKDTYKYCLYGYPTNMVADMILLLSAVGASTPAARSPTRHRISGAS